MTFPIGFWFSGGRLMIKEQLKLLDTVHLIIEDRNSESLYLSDSLSLVTTPRVLIIDLAEYLKFGDLATLVKRVAVNDQLRLLDSLSIVVTSRFITKDLAEYLEFDEQRVEKRLAEYMTFGDDTVSELVPPSDMLADFTPFEMDYADLNWIAGETSAETVVGMSKNSGPWTDIAGSPFAAGIDNVTATEMIGVPGDLFQWRAKHIKAGFQDSMYCYSNILEHV